MGRTGDAHSHMSNQRVLPWAAKPEGQLGQPGPELLIWDCFGFAVRDHHLRNRQEGYGSRGRSVSALWIKRK